MGDYNESVFINCPFDRGYKTLFDAIVFTMFDCGFIARCALEENDSSVNRLEKIYTIISECRYGIHDISRTDLDPDNQLPRFNMSLELGIFLGSKKFGQDIHQKKKCLIIDTQQYRYQKFISDISGQDVEAHNNQPEKVVIVVCNWLRNASRRITIPGAQEIWRRYCVFRKRGISKMCNDNNLSIDELTFNDYAWLVTGWLRALDKRKLKFIADKQRVSRIS
jgi:hypothetical protein